MPPVASVRAHYAALCAEAARRFGSASLAGRWLLVDRLEAEGDALLIAASIAGAASLVIESDPEAARYSVRSGIVDFAVNTLDETLRILKNEIRKRQPIAVLLEADGESAAAAMVERGAQPDLLSAGSAKSSGQAWAILEERGALMLPGLASETTAPSGDVCWRSESGSAVLRHLDLLAAQILPESDLERQNWLARAPRYLPRAFRAERCVRMFTAECQEFLSAVGKQAKQGTLIGRVTVEAHGQNVTFG